MGAFFTNVQVLVPEGREQAARDAIVTTLAERTNDEGFVTCEPDETAERTILVGPRDAGSVSTTKPPNRRT